MNFKILLTFLMTISFCSCNGQNTNANNITTATPMPINRFDKALFQLINSDDTTLNQQLLNQYPLMTEILGKGILNMQSPEMPGFFNKLENFYSEPTLKNLYADAIKKYDSVTETEQSIGNAFAWIHEKFPAMQIPALYMHVSGFNQNVLVGDSLLSLSIDKYMGEDYPLYKRFYYEYQCRSMRPDRIVPDCFVFYLMSYYPFPFQEGSCLLDQMMHSGKINYAVKKLLEYGSTGDAMGYSETEEKWCRENEKYIWEYMLKNRHLYARDPMVVRKYMKPAPFTAFFGENAPALIGTWMGTRIVSAYMKNHKDVSLQQLLETTDYHRMLEESKYLN